MTTAPAAAPAWKLWANPIIRRYCRSRLRPQGLGAALIVVLLFAGFIFFGTRTTGVYRSHMLQVDAERLPITSLLVLQALILFFLGTGQVAGGMTAEADEGVLDYQRLSPMTPLSKVLGYLFGLPVREWIMFASTLPFTAWCMWRGQVPLVSCMSVYAVFVSSALLYHLTGLAAGTVIKNRRWAFLSSMGIILLLYTIMPQISHFGLLFFDYLTVWPVLDDHIHNFVPRDAGKVLQVAAQLFPKVKFYNLEFSELVFTLGCQCALGTTLVMMVWRRWLNAESHLLGKAWAVGTFAFVQVLLLGNALPLIEPGQIFPSQSFGRRFLRESNWSPQLGEGITVIGVYGFVTMMLMLLLGSMITPAIDTQLRGLRRARKLSLPRVPRLSDPASSFLFIVTMAILGAIGWYVFGNAMMSSPWFPGHALPNYTPFVFALVLLNAGLTTHALTEGWGGKRLFIAVVFFGILPPMVGAILGIAGDKLLTITTWLSSMSPFTGSATAAASLVPNADLPKEIARAVPRAFWFWQTVNFLITCWLVVQLKAVQVLRRKSVQGESC